MMTIPMPSERTWKRIFLALIGAAALFALSVAYVFHFAFLEMFREPTFCAVVGIVVLLMIRWQTGVNWFMWIARIALRCEGIQRAIEEGCVEFVRFVKENWRARETAARREVAN